MFLGDDFLLDTPVAKVLFHECAAEKPIYDYHCHLPPREIAENKQYESISEIWLGGDHYKWRALRANGVEERLITGDADPWDKFEAWANTVPRTVGNPLYQWTHLELRRYFGINDILGPDTAKRIYDECNEKLRTDGFRARSLMKNMKVKVVCTTDDPTDDLRFHTSIAADTDFDIPIFPAFRPDKVFKLEDPTAWNVWIDTLADATGSQIESFDDLLQALENRVDFFHANGCRLSDHGILAPFPVGSASVAQTVFTTARSGGVAGAQDIDLFCGAILLELARMYRKRDWVMQIHFGAVRNNSTRMFRILGPDTGYDAAGDALVAENLVSFLDALDVDDQLPKTILYTLNPRENDLLATIAGSFQGGGVAGKMQFGSGWWFNDQRDGMERQMTTLANIGLLSRFVGMTTDSRSFLSYPRHEYFRRVLCRLIGRWVADGELPEDFGLLGQLVGDVSYRNASEYFRLTNS